MPGTTRDDAYASACDADAWLLRLLRRIVRVLCFEKTHRRRGIPENVSEHLVFILRGTALCSFHTALTVLHANRIEVPSAVLVHERGLHMMDRLLRADHNERLLLRVHHRGGDMSAVLCRISEIRAGIAAADHPPFGDIAA